jgi:hypothetical protein
MPAFAGMTAYLFTSLETLLSILRQFKPPNAFSEIPSPAAKILDPPAHGTFQHDGDP